MNQKNTSLKRNFLLSITAQAISLMVSLLLTLIVPKCIDEYQYAYWQTFVLYIGYVGGLHFGLLDGIVLRYSQYDYEELDKPRIRSQFQILLYSLGIISGILCIIGFLTDNIYARIILILIAIGILTKQLTGYNSYMFQITNRINQYAKLIFYQRVIYGILVVLLLLGHFHAFYWICIAELIGDSAAFMLTTRYNREIYFGKALPLKDAIYEWKDNVSVGIILMLANWSSMLIVGGAKMVVQWNWDALTFGKFSFAFSVSNLFLTFVTAISVVLFPTLKRMDAAQLPNLYVKIRNYVSILLFSAMLMYFPMAWVLKLYLPKYSQSLVYLAILLPMIIYSSRISLLTNNYLKAYRKERQMFIINMVSIAAAIGCYLIGGFILKDIYWILISVVFVTALKSIFSEQCVSQEIQCKFQKEYMMETILTIGFILCAMYFGLLQGFMVYLILLVIYFLVKRNVMQEIINETTKNIFRKRFR